MGSLSVQVSEPEAVLQNIKGEKKMNPKFRSYKAQELLSELNTHTLCTSFTHTIHSQAFSARKQHRTAALFICILMPSMVYADSCVMSTLLAIQFSKLEGLLPLERSLEFAVLANTNMSPSETVMDF